MIIKNIYRKSIEEFNSTLTQDVLKLYILEYLLTHTYVKTVNMAKDIINKQFGIDWRYCDYNTYVNSITHKMIRIMINLKKSGIVERYSPRVYKVVKKNIKIFN